MSRFSIRTRWSGVPPGQLAGQHLRAQQALLPPPRRWRTPGCGAARDAAVGAAPSLARPAAAQAGAWPRLAAASGSCQDPLAGEQPRQGQHPGHPRGIVVRAVVDRVPARVRGADVVVVRADQEPLAAQGRIGALQEAHDVAGLGTAGFPEAGCAAWRARLRQRKARRPAAGIHRFLQPEQAPRSRRSLPTSSRLRCTARKSAPRDVRRPAPAGSRRPAATGPPPGRCPAGRPPAACRPRPGGARSRPWSGKRRGPCWPVPAKRLRGSAFPGSCRRTSTKLPLTSSPR